LFSSSKTSLLQENNKKQNNHSTPHLGGESHLDVVARHALARRVVNGGLHFEVTILKRKKVN